MVLSKAGHKKLGSPVLMFSLSQHLVTVNYVEEINNLEKIYHNIRIQF